MYETILVPVDGSSGSEAALHHGIDIADRYDATVHLIHVVDESVYEHYGGIDAIERAEEALRERGEQILDDGQDQAERESPPVETHMKHTTPHQGILDTARRVGADLIVMGTERYPDEYRRLIGSVSERVVRQSPIAVHLVKTEYND